MTTLVSGSNGWIGQALTAYFQEQGRTWLAVSRQEISQRRFSDASLKAYLSAPDHARSHVSEPSCAIHLAGLAHVKTQAHNDDSHRDDPHRQANYYHAVNFAQLCKQQGIARFVFVSSAKIIGDATLVPANQTSLPAPNDPYSRAKLSAETALLQLHEPGRFEVIILRPPLVYGEGVRANFLQLLDLADNPLPLPLLYNTQRSMIYLGNLVSALDHARTAPLLVGKAWFIKDDCDYRLTELMGELRDQLGRPRRILAMKGVLPRFATQLIAKLPPISGKVLRMTESLQIDDSGFRASGWHAPFSNHQGIEKTVQWYRSSTASSPRKHQ